MSCPNNDHTKGAGCSAASVDAEKLAHQLIATLVNRVMTPRNLADIVERIQQGAYDILLTQREKLDNTESTIEELNSRKLDSLIKVEYGEVPFKKMVDSLEAMEAASAGLAYESAVARGEIDKLEFMSNEQAIRSVAQDIGTYTEFADPELAKQLVGTFIKDIRVGRHVVHGCVQPPHTGRKQRRTDQVGNLPAALNIGINEPQRPVVRKGDRPF